MKKIISLMLAFVIVAALGTGCSPKPSVASGDASKGGDIKVWLASTPETVDPALNSSMDGANYIIHLSQGLFRYKWDATGVEPGDAASYTVSDDGLVWTFTLRDDIKWSDGQKITAKDYEYSWKRFCDPNTAAPYAEDISVFIENGLEVLEGSASLDELGVKAISDDVLEVRLAGPCPFFDEIAVFPVLYPVRQDMIEANGATWWQNPETNISNGPFKLKSFTLEGEMVIVPNENYYDVAEVVPGSISFKFLADDIAAHNAILAGEIDISNQTPPEEIAAMKEKGMFFPKEQLGTYYISFNIEKEPFDNPLVRKALTLAIDRQYLGDEVTQGSYGPITAMVGKGFNDVESGKDFRDVGGNFIELDH